MFINRLSILLLSLTLGLAACESRAPEPAPMESGMGTYGARAIEPRFLVVEAPDGILEVDAVTDKATAEVYYAMKPRDKVRVQWQGSQAHSTAVQTVLIAKVLKFDLPKQWIEESAGQTVTLTYWYQTSGAGPEVSSAPLTLRVVGGVVNPVFSVLEAKPDGTLDADTLGAGATVRVLHSGMAPGDTLRVTWSGSPSRNTEIKPVLDRATPVDFAIPKSWVQENAGKTVQVFYTHEKAGTGTPVPSRSIQLRITSSIVENGRLIAARLDARYNNTRNDCQGRPAYFCNGVLLRTVDSGNFLSWNPSANAIAKNAVSFSFVRRDMGITHLAWNNVQGIIFQNPDSATATARQYIRVLCAFPSDAASWYRANQGCGAHSSYPSQSGYCSSQAVNSLDAWKRHYQALGGSGQFSVRNQHQCSFRGSDQAAFALSLTARAHFVRSSEERPFHNELMLQLWGQNLHHQLPLEAVFYHAERNPSSGLASARVIQRDFFNCTAKVLPVIRLSLRDGQASAFSFVAADQGLTGAETPSAAACRAKESK
jgi:hypothetical protein